MASERQANEQVSPWWGEHVHRYQIVEQQLTASDSVLDLACGSGYGSARLSEKTKGQVVGGDISSQAVEQCRNNWKKSANLEFRVLDGTSLSFPDESFERVVSFETIEHTTQFDRMLAEFNRVLKPGGRIFLSTPNFPVNSPEGKVTNPYHTQEFVLEEFKGLVEKHFSQPKVYGQKYVRYQKARGISALFARIAEGFFYLRGVRKLPISFQNFVMKMLIGKTQYPLPEDFELVSGEAEIRECKTFVAVCEKRK